MAATDKSAFRPGKNQSSPEAPTASPPQRKSFDSYDGIGPEISLIISGLRREWQHGKYPAALDSGGQLPLMLGAVAGHSTGDNFAAFGYKPAKQAVVLVIDISGFAFAKAADFSFPSLYHLFSLKLIDHYLR